MKKIHLCLLSFILALFTATTAFAGTYAEEKGAEFRLNQASPNAMAKDRLGSRVVMAQVRTAILRYDYAKQGGTNGTIALVSELGKPWTLPKGAVITGCFIDVATTPTGAGTISIGTGASATDLKGATAIASYTGIVACVPVGTAATAIKLSADQSPYITVASGPVTGGKFNVLVQYTISD